MTTRPTGENPCVRPENRAWKIARHHEQTRDLHHTRRQTRRIYNANTANLQHKHGEFAAQTRRIYNANTANLQSNHKSLTAMRGAYYNLVKRRQLFCGYRHYYDTGAKCINVAKVHESRCQNHSQHKTLWQQVFR